MKGFRKRSSQHCNSKETYRNRSELLLGSADFKLGLLDSRETEVRHVHLCKRYVNLYDPPKQVFCSHTEVASHKHVAASDISMNYVFLHINNTWVSMK